MAGYADGALMVVEDLLHDVQTESQSRVRRLSSWAGLEGDRALERVEQRGQQRRRNRISDVGDLERHIRRSRVESDDDCGSWRAMRDAIRHEVADHLRKPVAIPPADALVGRFEHD